MLKEPLIITKPRAKYNIFFCHFPVTHSFVISPTTELAYFTDADADIEDIRTGNDLF